MSLTINKTGKTNRLEGIIMKAKVPIFAYINSFLLLYISVFFFLLKDGAWG